MSKERNVEIIEDCDGTKIVKVNDIIFKGRQNIDWRDVEAYLIRFVGESYLIEETSDKIYIGKDLPEEYSWSKDTKRLKGALAKAKANGVQGIMEMIQIADNPKYLEDFDKRHGKAAEYGWYRYDTRFALPVYLDNEEVDRYNVFKVRMIVRHASNGKKYLYDMINIKKETGKPLVGK